MAPVNAEVLNRVAWFLGFLCVPLPSLVNRTVFRLLAIRVPGCLILVRIACLR
jgi:hypothetical protein